MPWEEEIGDVCTVSVLIGTRGGSDVVEDAEWSTVYCCWKQKDIRSVTIYPDSFFFLLLLFFWGISSKALTACRIVRERIFLRSGMKPCEPQQKNIEHISILLQFPDFEPRWRSRILYSCDRITATTTTTIIGLSFLKRTMYSLVRLR